MHTGNDAMTIDHLIKGLQDPDQVVRIHAATVLGSLREDAEPGVTALIHLLQHGDVHDRKLTALTLGLHFPQFPNTWEGKTPGKWHVHQDNGSFRPSISCMGFRQLAKSTQKPSLHV